MKQTQQTQYIDSYEANEMEILADQLDSKEMFLLGFLKGFDRKVMREWQRKGIGDYSMELI